MRLLLLPAGQMAQQKGEPQLSSDRLGYLEGRRRCHKGCAAAQSPPVHPSDQSINAGKASLSLCLARWSNRQTRARRLLKADQWITEPRLPLFYYDDDGTGRLQLCVLLRQVQLAGFMRQHPDDQTKPAPGLIEMQPRLAVINRHRRATERAPRD